MSYYRRRKREFWFKREGVRVRVYYDPREKFFGEKCKNCGHSIEEHPSGCYHWYPKARRLCLCPRFTSKVKKQEEVI